MRASTSSKHVHGSMHTSALLEPVNRTFSPALIQRASQKKECCLQACCSAFTLIKMQRYEPEWSSMQRQRQVHAVSRRQRLVGQIVVRGPDATAGDDGAAAAYELAQAQRGCSNIIFVVADDLYAHQVHAAAARSVS